MTRDDIIRMARWSGAHQSAISDAVCFRPGELEEFAALVAAAEREECAKVCEEEICSCCWDEDAEAAAEHLAEQIRARSNQCPS